MAFRLQKKARLMAVLGLALMLSGCGAQLLSQREIVRAVFLTAARKAIPPFSFSMISRANRTGIIKPHPPVGTPPPLPGTAPQVRCRAKRSTA